jgi:ABC-2 type transport system permease protein
MMLLVAPYLLAPMVMRSPNSTMAVVASFIPPTNAFVMMTRLASPTPPPAWHVLIAMALGLVAALGALWFAAKVFKVGLLMHGKPPNFATLIRWAREA